MQAQAKTRHCPKCGFEEEPESAECRSCGIIFAKYDPAREYTPRHLRTVSREEPRPSGRPGWKPGYREEPRPSGRPDWKPGYREEAGPSGRPGPGAPVRSRVPQSRMPSINWGAWLTVLLVIGAIAGFFYLDRPYEVVGATPAEADKVLILMHGFGAPGGDLVPRAESLSKKLPGVSFVVLEAPHSRGLGRAWMVGGTLDATIEQVAESRARVLETVEDLEADGVDSSRIYLGGYSQGAQMALDVAMHEDAGRQFGGLVLLSGGWPNWPEAPSANDLGTPQLGPASRVLVTHGRSDGVIAFATGKSVADKVGTIAATKFVALDGGHRLTEETEAAIVDFLAR